MSTKPPTGKLSQSREGAGRTADRGSSSSSAQKPSSPLVPLPMEPVSSWQHVQFLCWMASFRVTAGWLWTTWKSACFRFLVVISTYSRGHSCHRLKNLGKLKMSGNGGLWSRVERHFLGSQIFLGCCEPGNSAGTFVLNDCVTYFHPASDLDLSRGGKT